MQFHTDIRFLAYETLVENGFAALEKAQDDEVAFPCPICEHEAHCCREGIKVYVDCESCEAHMIGELKADV